MNSDGEHTRVLVPMKPLATAKSRLASSYDDGLRQGVVLALLDRVLRASVAALAPRAITVVGGDRQIRRLAEERSATWVEDPGWDLNSSLWIAISRAFQSERCDVALFLPGDLPLLTSVDVRSLLAAGEDGRWPVAARATADGGTNALLIPRASAFPPALGEDSFARHQAAALGAGSALRVVDRPGLVFDVDSVEDAQWALCSVEAFADEVKRWRDRLCEDPQRAVQPGEPVPQVGVPSPPPSPAEGRGSSETDSGMEGR